MPLLTMICSYHQEQIRRNNFLNEFNAQFIFEKPQRKEDVSEELAILFESEKIMKRSTQFSICLN